MKKTRHLTKKRIYDILEIGNKGDAASRAFDIFLVAVIGLNIAVLFLETFDSLRAYAGLFRGVEGFTFAVFLIEYLLRIWTSEYLYPSRTKLGAALRFLFSFDGIILLLTILPFFAFSGFVVLRMLRVVRIFHLFRINASYDSFHVITSVLTAKKNQIFSSVFIIGILMLASSLGMYSAEHEAQPEVFANALSGLWWSASTIFTIGYGDVYPVTAAGRAMAVVIDFLALGVVAIPTGILSAGFVEQYAKLMVRQAPGEEQNGLISMTIYADTPYCGRTVESVEDSELIDICVLIRGGLSALPTRNTVLEEGDILVCRKMV